MKYRRNFTITCTRKFKLVTISLCCDVTEALDLYKFAMKTQTSPVSYTCYFRHLAQCLNISLVYVLLLHNRARPKCTLIVHCWKTVVKVQTMQCA